MKMTFRYNASRIAWSRLRRTSLVWGILVLTLAASSHMLVSQSTGSDTRGNSLVAQAQSSRKQIEVKLRFTEAVSSADAKIGQVVSLEVVETVSVDGKRIIAIGALARGSVIKAKRRGHNHKEGQLVINVDTVKGIGGREFRLQSSIIQRGSGQGEPIFGPCTFPLPADPVGLFRKGSDVVIPKGTELIAVLAPVDL
jgi:hypothetical protein